MSEPTGASQREDPRDPTLRRSRCAGHITPPKRCADRSPTIRSAPPYGRHAPYGSSTDGRSPSPAPNILIAGSTRRTRPLATPYVWPPPTPHRSSVRPLTARPSTHADATAAPSEPHPTAPQAPSARGGRTASRRSQRPSRPHATRGSTCQRVTRARQSVPPPAHRQPGRRSAASPGPCANQRRNAAACAKRARTPWRWASRGAFGRGGPPVPRVRRTRRGGGGRRGRGRRGRSYGSRS